MNDKIKNHVKKYCESKGYGTTDEDIIEAIVEGKEVWSGNEDEHRHWIEYDKVIEIDGMFIQFVDAKGAGDIGVCDAGWEFDEDTIIEVQPKEVKTTIYEPVQ
jgi:hypothetical protein